MTQNVYWSEYREPDGLRVSMEAKVETTGDFATEEDGLGMFECAVYVKTSESPSDWYPLLNFPSSAENYTVRTYERQPSSISYAWND